MAVQRWWTFRFFTLQEIENQTDESQVSSSDEVKLSYDIVFKQRLRQILAENRICLFGFYLREALRHLRSVVNWCWRHSDVFFT